MGKRHASALGSIVERTTRTVILVPLKAKDATSVRKAFTRELKSLPRQMRLSMTYDRGKEMAEHDLFTSSTKIQVYFCHPQSPWERGTNENTNMLIRQFFPKGTDFNKVTRREIPRCKEPPHLILARKSRPRVRSTRRHVDQRRFEPLLRIHLAQFRQFVMRQGSMRKGVDQIRQWNKSQLPTNEQSQQLRSKVRKVRQFSKPDHGENAELKERGARRVD